MERLKGELSTEQVAAINSLITLSMAWANNTLPTNAAATRN